MQPDPLEYPPPNASYPDSSLLDAGLSSPIPPTHPKQWYTCPGGCDGFDCKFPINRKPPLKMLGELGNGTYGLVTKVQDNKEQIYALKTVKWCFRQNLLRSVQAEVKILKRLEHIHIVRICGSYIHGNTFYGLLTQPVADCDLSSYLDQIWDARMDSSSPFSGEHEIPLLISFGCLASGLTFIHENEIKHEDIKPKNILLKQGMVLFTDFGIARDFSDTSKSQSLGPTSTSVLVSRAF